MGYSDRIHRQSAVICWSEIVGSEISRETKALKMNRTLKEMSLEEMEAIWQEAKSI